MRITHTFLVPPLIYVDDLIILPQSSVIPGVPCEYPHFLLRMLSLVTDGSPVFFDLMSLTDLYHLLTCVFEERRRINILYILFLSGYAFGDIRADCENVSSGRSRCRIECSSIMAKWVALVRCKREVDGLQWKSCLHGIGWSSIRLAR